ncbi:hypothetical protein BH11MYX3_BH11MYX3_08820 [soil metagenome]
MRRFSVLLIAVAGCGFTAPAGESQPVDAQKAIDTPVPTDGAPPADAPVDMQIDAPPGAMCPAGYTTMIGVSTSPTSMYRFVATTAKWIDAEQDCEDDALTAGIPSHLIVLDDAAEKTGMLGVVTGDQYIGATDLAEEGEVRYVTSQATTLSLNPTMGADNKDCIRIKANGNEEYRDCNEANKYVCECDGNTANPGQFPNLPGGNN